MVCEQLWHFSQSFLKSALDMEEYDQHIRPIRARYDDEQCLELVFPNRHIKRAFTNKYIGVLKEEIKNSHPEFQSLSLRLVLDDDLEGAGLESGGIGVSQEAEPSPELSSSLNPGFTFNTWVGSCNELARAAAMQVAGAPGKVYNPLVIYGDVGLGKTHLMQAIGNHIASQNPEQEVAYVHSEQFVSEMIRALQKNDMEAFKERYRHCVLLLDDIQFFIKKVRSQEELFHTVNRLLDAGQQIVATSDRFPKDLEGFEARLKSRFSWGLTINVDPPELETRVAILLNKAKLAGVVLPEEVAFFMADRINTNVRELEGALRRLVANSSFLNREITIALAKESLKDLIGHQDKVISIDSIHKTVAHYYKITIAEILASTRKRAVARPRQLAMYLAKQLSACSLSQIGRDFGNRDHTTVMHACKTIDTLLKEDSALRADYDNLLRILNH